MESWKEKNHRLAGQWESDCAFEADYEWKNSLSENLGVSNLVDDTGDIVETDFPE